MFLHVHGHYVKTFNESSIHLSLTFYTKAYETICLLIIIQGSYLKMATWKGSSLINTHRQRERERCVSCVLPDVVQLNIFPVGSGLICLFCSCFTRPWVLFSCTLCQTHVSRPSWPLWGLKFSTVITSQPAASICLTTCIFYLTFYGWTSVSFRLRGAS